MTDKTKFELVVFVGVVPPAVILLWTVCTYLVLELIKEIF